MELYLEHYPKNEIEFDKQFKSEKACHKYLFQMRWKNGFKCPKCGHGKYYKINNILYECQKCKTQTSITAQTVMHKTRKPLKLWFKAMWWFTTSKNGVNAKSLQRLLGLRSYETAWTWLQKLRTCTVKENRSKLSGKVEVDECYIGGKEIGNQGRGSKNKKKVIIAVEKIGAKTGRTRMSVVNDCSSKSLLNFIRKNISEGSTIVTDGWRAYQSLDKEFYIHERKVISKMKEDGSEILPGVHIIASLFQRHLYGIFQGKSSEKHFQKYLDEFTFRYNRRLSHWVGKKFMRIVEQVMSTKHTSLREIINVS